MSPVNNATSSQLAYSYLQSKNKISGLVSGMDIESIMEKLMKAESSQMEKLQQQKQKYEWRRDAYREVNTKLETFRSDAFDNYSLSKNWNIRSVSNSSPSSVNVSAGTDATGNLTISKAEKAQAAQIVSKENTNISGATKISDLLGVAEGSFNMASIGEKGTLSNMAEIKYTSEDTVDSLVTKINSSKAGVTAIFANGKFSITANNTGRATDSAADIAVVGDNNQLFEKLGFTTNGATDFGLAQGKNATATINGVDISSNTNKFNVAGYNLELTANISSDVTISSTTDTDGAVKKVKDFITTYNDLIKTLNDKTIEKKNVGYEPLTDAQKAEMSEKEIEKWEETAKKGLLKGDSNLRNVLSDLRSTLYSTDKDKLTLASIGVSTTSTYTDGGQLQLDEEKLKAALEKDPDILSKVFTGDTGVISTMRDSSKQAIDNIKNVAGSTLSTSEKTYSIGRDISNLTDKIENWKDRLKGIEDRYWKQFSAMETAIQKANSQSSIFMQG